ncbi:MAG: indole-3-glycerol phosphate synthase TrpC [Eudoraea sp.]|nr:indole-3-glycerol phosphate synthase TrpC [Eudoraea sp.]
MDILQKIVRDKRKEVALKKSIVPLPWLELSELFKREASSLSDALRKSATGIIAEHKRRSPSKAVINTTLNVADVATGYKNAGVCGMSVLTDGKYFGGSLDDLLLARAATNLPLLRKEFIIDEYQIVEAKAYGADAILLIAAILEAKQIEQFSILTKSLGMDVLLEVHNAEELQKSIMPSLDMVGVNNRNLRTFEVDLANSKALSTLIPDDFIKVSESGISSIEAINALRPYGFKGFLIGENFMKTNDPGAHASNFIKNLER